MANDREAVRLQNLEDAARGRVEFPTQAEWNNAQEALNGALSAVVDVAWKLKRIAEFRGSRAPTLEDLGFIFSNSIDLESRFKELSHWVHAPKGALSQLDYVRVHDNIDPDPEDDDA